MKITKNELKTYRYSKLFDFSIVLKNVEECRKRKLTKYKKCDQIL